MFLHHSVRTRLSFCCTQSFTDPSSLQLQELGAVSLHRHVSKLYSTSLSHTRPTCSCATHYSSPCLRESALRTGASVSRTVRSHLVEHLSEHPDMSSVLFVQMPLNNVATDRRYEKSLGWGGPWGACGDADDADEGKTKFVAKWLKGGTEITTRPKDGRKRKKERSTNALKPRKPTKNKNVGTHSQPVALT